MTAVAAYLTCVIAITAVMCCHQGEGAPPGGRRIARAVRRHRPAWARDSREARRFARRTRRRTT